MRNSFNPRSTLSKSNTSSSLARKPKISTGNKTILNYVNKRLAEMEHNGCKTTKGQSPLYTQQIDYNLQQFKPKTTPIPNKIKCVIKKEEPTIVLENNLSKKLMDFDELEKKVDKIEKTKNESFLHSAKKEYNVFDNKIQSFIDEVNIEDTVIESDDDVKQLKEELMRIKQENYCLKRELAHSKKKIKELENFIQNNLEDNYENSYCICPKPTPYVKKCSDDTFDYKKNSNALFSFSSNFIQELPNVEPIQKHCREGKSSSTNSNSNNISNCVSGK